MPLEWKFQKRLEVPKEFGTSKDFFVPLEWKFREGGKICEGSNFEIAVTVISRREITYLTKTQGLSKDYPGTIWGLPKDYLVS